MPGIASLGVAFNGFLFTPPAKWERRWVALASFLFIAPVLGTMAVGLIAMAPIWTGVCGPATTIMATVHDLGWQMTSP